MVWSHNPGTPDPVVEDPPSEPVCGWTIHSSAVGLAWLDSEGHSVDGCCTDS